MSIGMNKIEFGDRFDGPTTSQVSTLPKVDSGFSILKKG